MITDIGWQAWAAAAVVTVVAVALGLLFRRRPVPPEEMDALIKATREPEPAKFNMDLWEEEWERQQGDRL